MFSKYVCAVFFLLMMGVGHGRVGGEEVPEGVIMGTGNTIGFGELEEEWRGEVIRLSWSPRAFLLKGFLTDEECAHLIKEATPSMADSTVVDNDTGESIPSDIRTSTGMFLRRHHDPIIEKIERRVSQVTMIPVENQEGMQILRYINGQKYEPHFDYFHDQMNTKLELGGQRIMTVLMYLTTPTKGGETVFPNAETKVTGPEWSDCAQEGYAVKTFKGDAVMFYGLKPDGTKDKSSLHGSCPTYEGEKWSATKWIHVHPFGLSPSEQKEHFGGCIDYERKCDMWAKDNGCESNPVYMKRMCPRACGECIPKA